MSSSQSSSIGSSQSNSVQYTPKAVTESRIQTIIKSDKTGTALVAFLAAAVATLVLSSLVWSGVLLPATAFFVGLGGLAATALFAGFILGRLACQRQKTITDTTTVVQQQQSTSQPTTVNQQQPQQQVVPPVSTSATLTPSVPLSQPITQ